MAANSSPKKRRLFWIGVLSGVGILLARLLFLQGIFIPIRIEGGSMADTLVGDHFAFVCDDCRFPFRCGIEGLKPDEVVVCPHCGYPDNKATAEKSRRGQRVFIDRFPTFTTPPPRWQIVAVEDPRTPGDLAVKRIIGLPGERLAIRRGDLFIDGQIVTKPLAVQQALRIPVYEEQYRPRRTKDLPARWVGEHAKGHWRMLADGYSYSRQGLPQPPLEWLNYHHWRCFSSPLPRTDDVLLLDNDAYSPHESRQLHEVADMTLSFRAQLQPITWLQVALKSRRDQFVFWLAADHKAWRCEQNGKAIAKGSMTALLPECEYEWEFSLCDQTAAFRLDGAEIFLTSFTPTSPTLPSEWDGKEVWHPCAIGAQGNGVQIKNLRIFRDINYLPPWGRGDNWERPEPLGPDEFFVLGDNPAISVDSRDPAFGAIPRKAIIGQVLSP